MVTQEGLAKLTVNEFQLTNQIAHVSSCLKSRATRLTARGLFERGTYPNMRSTRHGHGSIKVVATVESL